MDWLSLTQALEDWTLNQLLLILATLLLFVAGIQLGRLSLRKELALARYNQKEAAEKTWWNNFWQGISTEFIGAVVTTLLFTGALGAVEQYQAVQNDKADLILQMSSPDNAFAIEAVRIASQKGWLTDGTLEGAQLPEANLQNADLTDANLKGARLWRVNLQAAFLLDANLQGANISTANLRGADLGGANLQNANLRNTNLGGAILLEVNLQGANLRNANLDDVKWVIDNDPPAILPDGTEWTPETDMSRFTDPNHPNFWQPPSNDE